MPSPITAPVLAHPRPAARACNVFVESRQIQVPAFFTGMAEFGLTGAMGHGIVAANGFTKEGPRSSRDQVSLPELWPEACRRRRWHWRRCLLHELRRSNRRAPVFHHGIFLSRTDPARAFSCR